MKAWLPYRIILVSLFTCLGYWAGAQVQCGAEPTQDNIFFDGTSPADSPLRFTSQAEVDAFVAPNGQKFVNVLKHIVIQGGGDDPITDLWTSSKKWRLKTISLQGFVK